MLFYSQFKHCRGWSVWSASTRSSTSGRVLGYCSINLWALWCYFQCHSELCSCIESCANILQVTSHKSCLQKESSAVLEMVIEESHSVWCSPIVIVVKKDRSIIFWADDCKMNEVLHSLTLGPVWHYLLFYNTGFDQELLSDSFVPRWCSPLCMVVANLF